MLMSSEEFGGVPGSLSGPTAATSEQHLVPIKSRKYEVSRRTRLERKLAVVILILVVLAFMLGIALSVVYGDYQKEIGQKKAYCSKQACIDSAAALLQAMDHAADPCQDFYQFACGKWGEAHPIPEARLSNSWFVEATQLLNRQLKDMMEQNSSELLAMRMLNNLYHSCVDTETLEALELEPLKEVLEAVGLTTQVPSGNSSPPFNVARSIASAQRLMSLDLLVQLSVGNMQNNSIRVLHLTPAAGSGAVGLLPDPEEDLPLAELTARDVLKLTVMYMMQVLHYVGNWQGNETSGVDVSDTPEIATKILLFEVFIRNISKKHDSPYSRELMNMTFAELQAILDKHSPDGRVLDLEEYLRVLFDGVNNTMDYNNDIIYVSNLPYFVRLMDMLKPERMQTVQRYIWWRVVRFLIPYSNEKLRGLEKQFHERILGSARRTPRADTCVREVKEQMPMAVGYGMSEKNPISNTISRVKDMLDDIRSGFYSLVNAADWMDEETKKVTLDKAESVTSFIGYPDWLHEPGKLDKYYSGLNLVDGQYMRNILKFKEKSVVDLMRTLGSLEPNESKSTWDFIDPVQVNAFYTRVSNSIIIPAGILQVPFYGRGHEALNYASIGAILGHELTHGFDSEGKDYDKYGNHISWWNKKMVSEYNKRAKCFVEQYNRFRLPGRKKVNGHSTLAENIADNGGLREALLAYRRYVKRNGPEPKLVGLEDFSPEQIFFLGFANLWCQSSKPRYDDAILRDRHSPARFRVLGTLSNMPAFTEAWRCPSNCSMNPARKCVVW